jgi:hypothetical protein
MTIELFACGIMILVAGTLSILRGVPAVWSPFPLLVVIPSFLIGATPIRLLAALPFGDFILSILAAIPITAAYFAWSIGPVATSRIPLRSVVLLVVVAAITLVVFIVGWKDGVRYQGLSHTVALALINFVLFVAIFIILILHRTAPSNVLSQTFHGALFLWLSWFALPWLGGAWDD